MALMRVYCGLAASEPTDAPSGAWLTVAVVDDAGRLLDVCEVGDDPAGYAVLGALLAERSGGAASVAVAADSDEHQVTLLLAAAGRPLVIADEGMVDDYAERFADDDSADEVEAGEAERSAVGLARALAAGALTAATQITPREMVALKPVLSAHAAVTVSRNASAVALREVLRELYPAALRAYPDPAEPVPLAVLDALPEPGMLGTTNNSRGRDAAVAADLAKAGVGDPGTIAEAITALRVAIAETPRRTGVGKGPTAAVAETIRQAVAAVRAWDAAETALIGLLSVKGAIRREQPVALRAVGSPAPIPTAPRGVGGARRVRAAEVAAPASAPPVRVAEPAPRPVGRPLARPAARIPEPRMPDARPVEPRRAEPAAIAVPAAEIRTAEPPYAPEPRHAPETRYAYAPEQQYVPEPPRAPEPRYAPEPPRAPEPQPYQPAAGYQPPAPVAGAQPYQPPIAGAQQPYAPVDTPRAGTGGPTQGLTPSWAAESFSGYPPVTSGIPSAGYGDTAGYPGEPYAPTHRSGAYPTVGDQARAPGYPLEPRYPSDATQQPTTGGYPAVSANGYHDEPHRGYPAPEYPAPGSRDLWPLVPAEDDGMARVAPGYQEPYQAPREGRVAPPWQTDDLELPAEPAALRTPGNPPTLRLVGRDDDVVVPSGPSALDMPRAHAPVDDEADGDLLIFAQARSAWFVTQPEPDAEPLTWSDAADQGWVAAERASHPQTGGETDMGLPRRVPKANLVPGSPLPPMSDAGLRIVRDPAAMAAHTTGYFRGSRRGEEVRGYAVASRPGRESGGGWDFSRDGWETDSETEYRSAARR